MKTAKIVLGIDEAGRGCAIGPMVVCGVLLDQKTTGELKAEGVKDSKMLTPARRTQLAHKIMEVARGVFIEEIPPSEIQERNLNLLEIWRAARIISTSTASRVYMDAPVATDRGIKAFCEHIKWCVGKTCPEIVAENRADATYIVVGAASIVAKVRRDSVVEELREQFGDFGSGYPSDEKTQRFLRDCYRKNGRFPDCVRRRWKTVTQIAAPVQAMLPLGDEGIA
jgi:ribonuclease HII